MFLTKDPVEFLWHYGKYTTKEKVREAISKHLQYKTCRILLSDDDTVCACCLWNIDPDCITAHVCELAIREDYTKRDIMRRILMDGLKIWPIQFLTFYRNNNGRLHVWSVKRFLRRKA